MPQPAPHGTDQISTGHHEQSQLGNTQFFQLWDATFYPCGVTAFKCSWKQYSQHSDRTKGREDRRHGLVTKWSGWIKSWTAHFE